MFAMSAGGAIQEYETPSREGADERAMTQIRVPSCLGPVVLLLAETVHDGHSRKPERQVMSELGRMN
jgi:hypothetical protein